MMITTSTLDSLTNQPLDARRAERVELYTETQGILSAEKAEPVLIHNLSATGLLLETETTLQAGQRIHVMLPEVGLTAALVVWCSDALYGCRFDDALSHEILSAAQSQDPLAAQSVKGDGQAPMNDLSVRLRALREERGLSLAALARRAGISKPSIWAWERGKTVPRPRSIAALAKAMGVTSEQILGQPAAQGRDIVVRVPATGAHGVAELSGVVAAARASIAAAAAVLPERVHISIDY